MCNAVSRKEQGNIERKEEKRWVGMSDTVRSGAAPRTMTIQQRCAQINAATAGKNRTGQDRTR